MAKQILYDTEAQEALKRGVDKLAKAVAGTLGAKGKPVLIYRGGPRWTLDGVTVAREIVLPDPVENQGAEFVKQVAGRANDEVGDGTSTATIVCQSLLEEGLKGVTARMDPHRIKAGIEKGVRAVVAAVKKGVRPVKTEAQIAEVATISSREREIGEVVGRVFKRVGVDGVVAVEESKEIGVREELVEGLELDSGFASPYFMTNMERKEAAVENPYILVTTQVVSTNQDLVNILQEVAGKDSKAFVVVAEDVTGEALATLALNKVQGRLKCLAVKAPGHGAQKREYLEDLAAVTGATLISEELGKRAEDAELKDLGRCGLVLSRQKKTVFVGGKGKKAAIDTHIRSLKTLIAKEESQYKREILERRYARVSGGVGVIRVGSLTAAEQGERHYRVEDAVAAAKAALAEGIVIGGGIALYRAAEELRRQAESEKDLAVRFGMEALAIACERPARQVIANAGADPSVIMERLTVAKDAGRGWDAMTGEFVDMFKAGIVDPFKVVRTAVETAASVTGYFLVAGAVIADEPEKKVEKKGRDE